MMETFQKLKHMLLIYNACTPHFQLPSRHLAHKGMDMMRQPQKLASLWIPGSTICRVDGCFPYFFTKPFFRNCSAINIFLSKEIRIPTTIALFTGSIVATHT